MKDLAGELAAARRRAAAQPRGRTGAPRRDQAEAVDRSAAEPGRVLETADGATPRRRGSFGRAAPARPARASYETSDGE